MTGINIITKLLVLSIFIIISAISSCSSTISDRRLCFNPQCSVPVAKAVTLLDYPSNDPGILSFKSNAEVTVFSKAAGKRKDLWGVEINGKRGYVPSKFLKEKKILRKELIHEVPTEDFVTPIPENETQETDKENNVPNIPVEKTVVDSKEEEENEDTIEKKLESGPMFDDVSPSYEIHDGTWLPLAQDLDPPEHSYATRMPDGIIDIGEQPILSIHPNIVSSSTLKTDEDAVEEADNYLETPETKDLDDSVPIVQDDVLVDSNEPITEPNLAESTDNIENGVETEKAAELSEAIPSSREIIEDNTEIDNSENANDTQKAVVDNSEQQADISTDAKTPEIPTIEQEQVEKKDYTDISFGVGATELPDGNAEDISSDPVTVSHDSFNDDVPSNNDTATLSTQDNEPIDQTIVTDNSTEVPTTSEIVAGDNEPIQNNVTNEVQESLPTPTDQLLEDIEPIPSDSRSDTQESLQSLPESLAKSEQVENENLPDVSKPSQDVPINNLKNLNPLLNRLSKAPIVVAPKVPENQVTQDTSNEEIIATDETEIKSDIDLNTETANHNINDQNETAEVAQNAELIPESVETSDHDMIVNNTNNNIVDSEKSANDSTADSVDTQTRSVEQPVQPGIYKEDELTGFSQESSTIDVASSFNGFPGNRNLLNVGSGLQPDTRGYDSQEEIEKSEASISDTVIDSSNALEIEEPPEVKDEKSEGEATTEVPKISETLEETMVDQDSAETQQTCVMDNSCKEPEIDEGTLPLEEEDDTGIAESIEIIGRNYWETITYVVITAFTTLLFSLGYYYIENMRRDGQLIAKINKLEKELLVSSKECVVLDDTLKSTKSKLDSIEDESFGSNEMVSSLKADLEVAIAAKAELEDQIGMLEKELESATEAGLELERMLREILSTNNADNPLAKSVEDLQTRLNAQQAANEALTNALNLKSQENEALTSDLAAITQKYEQLEVEVTSITEELKLQNNLKINFEKTMMNKVEHLEKQVKDLSAEKINLRQQLKGKEMEMKDLLEVVNQMNINNLDFEKLYNVSRVKAEASQLLEERDDLKIRLSEVEGAHQLLEEHVKLINEEVASLSEQCKLAEKAKRDAETRVEVLSNFFKEKEEQRQKEEAVWLQKQGEVSTTVERLHTMQNEIHNYKQQIEMLKREILDQEREYKNQIAILETKSHEQWVIARQHERRLEESKAEAGQLRNRLTLIEKNLNDTDPEAKLHRLESNGDAVSSPQLFIGAEASSSPIMFTGSSGVPPPLPPSFMYGPPLPPFMPPPPHVTSGIPHYDVGQRLPPLGGRLSSPPPHPRYDNNRSPPPPLSPSMLPSYGPLHRSYPPPFPNDRTHLPPPPPHSSMLPPSTHTWADDSLPPLRNSGYHPHQQHHRDQQRARNHQGSLHSSGESLDKNL